MNAFQGYEPQLKWSDLGRNAQNSRNGTKGTEPDSAQIALKGSRKGRLMDIPSRDSINTETTKPADKQHKIKKGTL